MENVRYAGNVSSVGVGGSIRATASTPVVERDERFRDRYAALVPCVPYRGCELAERLCAESRVGYDIPAATNRGLIFLAEVKKSERSSFTVVDGIPTEFWDENVSLDSSKDSLTVVVYCRM